MPVGAGGYFDASVVFSEVAVFEATVMFVSSFAPFCEVTVLEQEIKLEKEKAKMMNILVFFNKFRIISNRCPAIAKL